MRERFDEADAVRRYQLAQVESDARVATLLRARPPRVSDPVVCYELESPYLEDVARTVEQRVFEERFGNSAEDMARIYGPFEDASSFFLAVDQLRGTPVGALRVIEASPAGLPTFNYLPESATLAPTGDIMAAEGITTLTSCWDVGTVAVLPGYRRQGYGVSVQLYRAMWRSAEMHGIEHLLAVLDEIPYRTLTRYLGIPFRQMVQTTSFSYEGSKVSVAVHGYTPDFERQMRRKSLTLRGLMARKALWPLVYGTRDMSIDLGGA